MTVKLLGAGTLVAVQDPVDTGPYETVGCIYSITPPGVEFENVESELCLSDSVSTTPESAPGDPVADEVAFEGAFDLGSTEDAMLTAIAAAKAVRSWRITYPNTKTQTFPGYLRRYKAQAVTRKEYMRIEGVIVRTGAIVVA